MIRKCIRVFCAAAAVTPLLLFSSAASAEYDFEILLPPGATDSQAFGINQSGQVALNGGGGGIDASFLYDPKTGVYTVVDEAFSVIGLSQSGVMVGSNLDDECAIRDKKGVVTAFTPPTNPAVCQARGINANGLVAGFAIQASGEWSGFVYDPKKDVYEEFLPSPQTLAHGINAQGEIAGSVLLFPDDAYPGSAPGRYGYIRGKDGSVSYFEISQALPGQTRGRGLSDNGHVAGYYFDPNFEAKAFVTTLSGGPDFESVTLTDDQIIYRKPCDPSVVSPGPDYVLFTDVFASHVTNDGVVAGSCNDTFFNPDTGDVIGQSRGFIATPAK